MNDVEPMPADAAGPGDHPGTRETILAAALRAFAQDGEINMERVAQAAGMSRATVYYHFHGRDALVEVLLEEGLAELAAEVADAAVTGDPVRVVEAIVCHYGENEVRSRMLFMSIWSQPAGLPRLLRRLDNDVVAPLRRAIAARAAAGRCADIDPGLAAEALFGMINEVVLGRVIRGESLDAQGLAPGLADLARRALAP